MQSLIKDARLPDVRLPDFERPTLAMPDLDGPKADVGKAIVSAATAVGLVKTPRRSRWPFLLGAGLVVALAGWTVMNAAGIRERVGRAKGWIEDRVGAVPTEPVDQDSQDPVAFTAADTQPIEKPATTVVSASTNADYPEGLGISTEPAATNGRTTAASKV